MVKNISIFSFGFLGFITGSFVSIQKIIESFSNKWVWTHISIALSIHLIPTLKHRKLRHRYPMVDYSNQDVLMECGKSVFIMIAFISHEIDGKERHLKELSFFPDVVEASTDNSKRCLIVVVISICSGLAWKDPPLASLGTQTGLGWAWSGWCPGHSGGRKQPPHPAS